MPGDPGGRGLSTGGLNDVGRPEALRERLTILLRREGVREELAPGFPRKAVRAFGDVLRHAYDQVDPTRIWKIVAHDLPAMAAAVEAALRRLGSPPD